MALGASRGWKKQRSVISGSKYWHSAESRLSVALERSQAFIAVASGESPVDPFPSGQRTAVPEGFGEFGRGAVLSCWVDDPGPVINQVFRRMEIPIELPTERICIGLFQVDEDNAPGEEQLYTANIQLQFSGTSQARAFMILFSIARGFITHDTAGDYYALMAAILFSNPPVQDGTNLTITTNALNSGEIALLFNIFSL
jgi:hypothetical protein